MTFFDDAVLRPLIERVVVAVLDGLESQRETVGERMANGEADAAILWA